MYILSISEEILSYICGLGILQGIFLAFLIQFHPKSDQSVNIFLALFIFFNSVLVTIPFVLKTVYWQNSAFIQPVPLLLGPLLYLYLRSFREKITWRKALPHFIPFLLFFYPVWWSIDVMAQKYPDATTLPTDVLQHPRTKVLMYFRLAHLLVYYFVARHTLNAYQRSIHQLFSQTSRISLNWARFLVNGYLVLFLCLFIVFTLMFRYPEYFSFLLLLNMSFATIYIYAVTVKGVTQPSIWQIQSGTKKEVLEKEMHEAESFGSAQDRSSGSAQSSPRQSKTGLSEDKMEPIIKRIRELMEEEKLYHETELTLRQLSDKLQLPTYQVSQVINEGMKKNFYDLVNNYRVEQAKQLLLDPASSNYTVLSIGFESGFNSKTTFNTVFKKFTGLTPTEYREQHRPVYAEG